MTSSLTSFLTFLSSSLTSSMTASMTSSLTSFLAFCLSSSLTSSWTDDDEVQRSRSGASNPGGCGVATPRFWAGESRGGRRGVVDEQRRRPGPEFGGTENFSNQLLLGKSFHFNAENF